MPELPEVERVRRRLAPVLTGVRVDRVVLHRAGLRRPFAPDFAARVRGATATRMRRRGKYLLVDLSTGDTLVMHLGMSGGFRIARGSTAVERHDHVVFELASGVTISFNDARRFGVMQVVATAELEHVPPIGSLGPEPLSAAFDGTALARACAGSRRSIKVALLDQSVVAGVGNIYASEALHVAKLSPRQPAARLATRTGAPRAAAHALAAAIRSTLTRAIGWREGGARGRRFRVYEHAGERCPRRRCGGVIQRLTQAGRSTYFCPVCQRSVGVTSKTGPHPR